MYKRVLFLLLVLGLLVSSASAYDWWVGAYDLDGAGPYVAGDGVDWTAAGNWYPGSQPGNGDDPALGQLSLLGGFFGLAPIPTVSTDVTASGTVIYNTLRVGRSDASPASGSAQMKIVTGGNIETSSNFLIGGGAQLAGQLGALFMEGGTATSGASFKVGGDTSGGLFMTGGQINAPNFQLGSAWIGDTSSFTEGIVHLDGGNIDADWLSMKAVSSSGAVAHSWLDITDGTMTIDGVRIPGTGITTVELTGTAAVAQIQDWIDNADGVTGGITAYGGMDIWTTFPTGIFTPTPGWASVVVDLNTGTGVITLSAVPEPATIALLGLGALALIRRKR